MEWVRRGLWHSCFLLVFVLLQCFLFDRGVHFVCCFSSFVHARGCSLSLFSVMSDGHGNFF